MKNKFWFQSVCWLGWLGLTMLAIYTTKTDIRAWSLLILAAWIGLIVGLALWRRKKSPDTEATPFFKRLKSNTWFQSFIILLFASGTIWLIFLFPEGRRGLAAVIIGIGSLLIGVIYLSLMSVQSMKDKAAKIIENNKN